LRRGGDCGQDAAPGSGRGLSARPQAHHPSTSGRRAGAPERARPPSASSAVAPMHVRMAGRLSPDSGAPFLCRQPRPYGATNSPEILPRILILAQQATAAGMRHLGVAVGRRPGKRDTTPQHSDSRQALPSELIYDQHSNMAIRGPFFAIPASRHRMRIRS